MNINVVYILIPCKSVGLRHFYSVIQLNVII